ncbi:MAG: type IV pilin protein [Gammaproteobacteria bacterium]
MNSGRSGFSLIELLVVMAIAGILLVIAVPAYQQYMLDAHRTDATKTLLEVSNAESEYYTSNNVYAGNLTSLGYPADTVTSANGYYAVTATSSSPQTYTLTATPEGAQTRDTNCASFTLNSLGQKGVTGTDTETHCWQ